MNLEKRMRNSLSSLIDNFTNQTVQNQQVPKQHTTRERKSLPSLEKSPAPPAIYQKSNSTNGTTNKITNSNSKTIYPQMKEEDLSKQDIMKLSNDDNVNYSSKQATKDNDTTIALSERTPLNGLKKMKSPGSLKEPSKGPMATVASSASNWQRSSGLTFKSLFGLPLGKQQNQQRKLLSTATCSQQQIEPITISSPEANCKRSNDSKPIEATSMLSLSQSNSNLTSLPKAGIKNNKTATTTTINETTNSVTDIQARGNKSLEERMTLSTEELTIIDPDNNKKTRNDSNDRTAVVAAKNIISNNNNIIDGIKKGSPTTSSTLSSPASSSSTSSLNIQHDNEQQPANGSDKLHNNRRIFSQEVS